MGAEGYGGGEAAGGGGAAPPSSTFILQQPDASLPNAEALSTLASGLLKSTTGTGVVATAVAGVDYAVPAGTLANYLARAISIGGLAADFGYLWSDFELQAATTTPLGWGGAGTGGAGSVSLVPAGSACGIARYSSGATASGFAVQQTFQGIISNVSTSKGYMATRFRLNTTPDANSTLMVGLINAAGNATIAPGFFGGLSSANFVVQHGGLITGSFINLGVAKDTAFHIFEVYFKGDGKLYARIDGGTEFNATLSSPPSDFMSALIEARNGGTAANQSLDVDWLLIAGQRL
jgi:hypothetical protein